jgi:hypothetical protein
MLAAGEGADRPVQLERIAEEYGLRAKLLQEELDRRFGTADDKLDVSERNFQRQLDQRHKALDKAVAAALKASKLAVDKAEAATEKRFDSVRSNINLVIAALSALSAIIAVVVVVLVH